MYARSTRFTDEPSAIDAAVALVRDEILPAVEAIEGCGGLSMLVDRDTGGCVVTSSWESQEALRNSESTVGPLRDRVQKLFGSSPEIHEWEIAVLHRVQRVGQDACARVVWSRVEPDHVEEQVKIFKKDVLPQIEGLPGFLSVSLLTDRSTGLGVIATIYENAEAMAEGREAASDLRTDAIRQMSTEVLDVAELDVALAHLRVPETV